MTETIDPRHAGTVVDVEVVIPTYNEERVLGDSIRHLHRFLSAQLPFSWRIVIADNASSDRTVQIAEALARELAGVDVLCLDAKGRGRALRAAWTASDARVACYMDADLSADLGALLPLLVPLLSGDADVAIGTRLAPGARIIRSAKRELISRAYNRLLRVVLRAGFSDAQCGFKAVSRQAARTLVPDVRDDEWFFDTELLILAQRRGLRIHEVPVDWVEDPDSRVDIMPTALADLRGVARLAASVPIVTFMLLGLASTVAYALLFVVLAGLLGASGASAVALFITAVANTAANRRLTFGIHGRAQRLRHYIGGLVVFVLALGLTDGALAVLGDLDPRPGRPVQLGVLIAATLVVTVYRYVALSTVVFRSVRFQLGRLRRG